jgi:hypothetical protein
VRRRRSDGSDSKDRFCLTGGSTAHLKPHHYDLPDPPSNLRDGFAIPYECSSGVYT